VSRIQSRIFQLKTASSVPEVDVLPNEGVNILLFYNKSCAFIISSPVFFYNVKILFLKLLEYENISI